MTLLEEISEIMQSGNAPKVRELAEQGLNEGLSPEDLLNSLLNGMSIIGVKFKNNEIFVPEVLVAARAMNAGLDIIKPLLEDSGVEPAGKVIIGTVAGDMHDIGKNLVRMMMVGAGFDVVDLGTDVKPEQFLEKVTSENPDIVAMSALLTTTMPNMKAIIDTLEQAGVRDQVKVMIGGAPITDNFAKEIGADCYTPDAASAAEAALELVG